jgi:dethiobiotin synthetase
MSLGYFVTGTDTGVGKTWVSCALLRHLGQHYAQVVGMKPVAAGALDGSSHAPELAQNSDILALRAASSLKVSPELDNPYCLPLPVSPHLAAAAAGVCIELPLLLERYQQLSELADVVVVEGAGGFLVPLSPTQTGADLARLLGLPVLMVVGMRLGCLNHALLTAQAIRAEGLTLAGWVANRLDPTLAQADANVQTLVDRLQAPLLADVSYDAVQVGWRLFAS